MMDNQIINKYNINNGNHMINQNNQKTFKENNFNYNVFNIYIHLYNLSKKIENYLNRPFIIKKQCYLVNLDWIKEFKKKFNYKELEKYFELKCNINNLDNNLKEKDYIHKKFIESNFNTKIIDKNEFCTINQIYNKNIKGENKDLNFSYYKDFAIINTEIFFELVKNKFLFDMNQQIDIYLGNKILILEVGNTGLECIICQDYDNFKDEYLINYINEEYKNNAKKVIINNSLQFYFHINKISEKSYEDQYIYDSNSIKIATVININSNKKKEIINSIKKTFNNCYEEALSDSLNDKKREDESILDMKTQMVFNIKNYINSKNNKNMINLNNLIGNNNENKIEYVTKILKPKKEQKKEILPFDKYDPNKRIGLINLGNSCYINTVLQCLFRIPEIVQYFLKNSFNPFQYPLSFALNYFVQALYQPLNNNDNTTKYNPIYICNIVFSLNNNFSPTLPNDAKDFLIFVLGILHQELNKPEKFSYYNIIKDSDPLSNFFRYFASNYRSIISDMFNWTNQVKRTCSRCKSQIFSYQTFPYLILDLEKTRREKYEKHKQTKYSAAKQNNNNINNIEKWFNEYYSEKENIAIDLIDCIQYYYEYKNFFDFICPFCGVFCNQISTNRIYTSPNIFVLILNRGKNNIYSVKMSYPPILEIDKYIEKKVGPHRYELIGVITHLGLSGPNGHFIAYAKSPIDEKWYQYNDEKVKEADNFSIYNDGIAYILFYRGIKDT